MSDDLAVWLAAQIDADERMAKEAGGDAWHRRADSECDGRVEDHNDNPIVYDEGSPTAEEAEHIAEHDPARVLREVEAKRRIIERCAETLSTASHYTTVESCDELDAIPAEQVLRILASVYAGRTGWREEWAT